MDKGVKTISNLIYWFHTFRKTNVATKLCSRSSKSLSHKYLYCVIPVIVFSINIFNLICSGGLYTPLDKFTYFNDLSNSLGLTLLYFLSYFLSGYYPIKLEEFIEKGMDKELFDEMAKASKKKYPLLLIIIGLVLFGIAVAAGYFFYDAAKSNNCAYWIHSLDDFGRIYYCLFLGVTWYQSLSLLGMALLSGFIVYKTVEYGHLVYVEEDFNKNISILSAVNIVVTTFSYGLFYIIGSFLFIFNDKEAGKYQVYNIFYDDMSSLILILIVTSLVFMAFLPLQELFSFMKKKKDCLIADLNDKIVKEAIFEKREALISKRNDIIKQNVIYTTATNKIIFILSVLIPSIGVIFQGVELFLK
ncbi:MAG: hypothetical protein NC251_12275 [Lachnoclostridium sp.]|nr:hypothetical protein [Lachnospira sp.]MCM1249190.1 hypothetical protein [Lachnoclostridium sp.]